jgi:iron complex outermembrane receptor protein
VRAQLGAYVDDRTDIQFSIDWMKDDSGVRGARMLEANRFDAILTPGTGPFLPMDSRYDVRNGMSNLNETTLKGASMTVNHAFNDDFFFKYVLAKRESDTVTNIDFDTTPDKITDVKAYYSDEQVSNELQLNYDGGGRWRGVTGLYFFNGSAGGQVLNNFFNLSFGDTQGTVYTESTALYTDWTFDINEKLKLDVGARYTDEDKRAKVLNRSYTGPDFSTVIATPANFDKTVNFTNLSPKVSLDYQVNDDVMVYGLFSRGFKSGGYNIRANATAVPRSAEPFDDEQVDSFEIGSKMSFMDQRLFLNLSAFHNKYEDIQLSVFTELPGGGFFGDFTNAGQGTVNGLEVEYQFLPSEHWLVSGNLAWLDAKYDEYMSRGVDIADEETFTNAPDFSGAINVEWRTDLANGGRISARVGYSYQSDVVATTETRQATTLPLAPFGRPPISQDGYGLVNAGVIWSLNDAWTLSLQGTNLADEEYMTTGYNLNQAVGVYTGFYGPPRQYSLTARYDF